MLYALTRNITSWNLTNKKKVISTDTLRLRPFHDEMSCRKGCPQNHNVGGVVRQLYQMVNDGGGFRRFQMDVERLRMLQTYTCEKFVVKWKHYVVNTDFHTIWIISICHKNRFSKKINLANCSSKSSSNFMSSSRFLIKNVTRKKHETNGSTLVVSGPLNYQ